jgi:hypothetical protein
MSRARPPDAAAACGGEASPPPPGPASSSSMGLGEVGEGMLWFAAGSSSARSGRREVVPCGMGEHGRNAGRRE